MHIIACFKGVIEDAGLWKYSSQHVNRLMKPDSIVELINPMGFLSTRYYTTLYCFTGRVYLLRVIKDNKSRWFYQNQSQHTHLPWSAIYSEHGDVIENLWDLLRMCGVSLKVQNAIGNGFPSAQVITKFLPDYDIGKRTYTISATEYVITLRKSPT